MAVLCPWCPDFLPVALFAGLSHKMCKDCLAKLNPEFYVARVIVSGLFLAPFYHWTEDARRAVRFKTSADAVNAMHDLAYLDSEFEVLDGLSLVSK